MERHYTNTAETLVQRFQELDQVDTYRLDKDLTGSRTKVTVFNRGENQIVLSSEIVHNEEILTVSLYTKKDIEQVNKVNEITYVLDGDDYELVNQFIREVGFVF